MSRLEQAQSRLQDTYRKTFWAKIATLKTLGQRWETGDSKSEGELRRFAHQLQGSGASYGFEEISQKAALLKQAPKSQLPIAIEELLAVLEKLAPNQDFVSAKFHKVLQLLVVEDDIDQVLLLQEAFHIYNPNWKIISADSIDQAKSILTHTCVDAVILDLLLSQEDGRELLSQIRNTPSTATIPVAIVSVIQTLDDKLECLSLGADLFFEKPVNLELLAFSLTGIIERQQNLIRAMQTDPLTGLFNRASFITEFERHADLAARTGMPLSLGFLDLDRFKNVNDTYGHKVGDEVLLGLSKLLTQRLRKIDVVARWGGEEFIILFPNTSAYRAETAIQKLQNILRQETFGTPEHPLIKVTFSCGVVEVNPDEKLTHAVERADGLLYQAKESGRDRICLEGKSPNHQPDRILVVEDDLDMTRYIRYVLRKGGFQVTCLNNGQVALKLAQTEDFDLVLLDILLPGMTGLMLLKALRESHSYRNIPIIMLTGLGSVEHLEEAFAAGASDYLTKPFNDRELLARIKRLMK
ncbi:MAG: response regulator [Prochlorotrichaceae cyanobacterium]